MYKRLHIKYLTSAFLLVLIFSSCQDDGTTVPDDGTFGYKYYPVAMGKYWIYQVDSTIYDDAGANVISSSSYVKEEIVDFFINEFDDTTFVLNRSIAKNLNDEFTTTDAWTIEKNEFMVARTEENLRFVKLVFPVGLDRRWKGNQFDELIAIDVAGESIQVYKDWGDYVIVNEGQTLNTDSLQFKEVIEVLQGDATNEIERRYAKEYFAPDIGMIKKEMIILDTQCIFCPGESWEEKAEAGFILSQTLIEYN
ncbi:MAG: hypothetical protein HKN09_07150 [Saprospiraceae bacterium]|nr:hypothetical protein [Saprospiraceae bacterium]